MKNILLLFFTLFIMLGGRAQQSQDITFEHEGKTVYGTFSSPEGSGSFATIIINAGTGAMDRDGTIPMEGANVICLYPGLLNQTLRPYKQLSDAMVEAGYAVLTYDKIEFTYQTPAELGGITFEKLWLPVSSAIDYVKTRTDVDTTNIILIGHSEGSTLIPYIAKNRTDVRALVSIGGSRTPLDSLLAYQLVNIAQVCNGDVPFWQDQADQILGYFELIRSNNWNLTTPPILGVPAAAWSDYIHVADSVSINYNLAHLPTLFTGLGDDINVPPAELTRFENEVTVTEDFWSIPNVNHYMTTANNPNVSLVLTDTIIYWLGQHIWPTGLGKIEGESFSFEVYPNPFSNEFVVKGELPGSNNLEISVRNALGQEIVREKLYNADSGFRHKFSTRSFAKGFYIVTIESDEARITKKVIKE